MKRQKQHRDDINHWAWIGGYPVHYTTQDIDVLCPRCAWAVVDDADVYFGGINEEEPLTCDVCSGVIDGK